MRMSLAGMNSFRRTSLMGRGEVFFSVTCDFIYSAGNCWGKSDKRNS